MQRHVLAREKTRKRHRLPYLLSPLSLACAFPYILEGPGKSPPPFHSQKISLYLVQLHPPPSLTNPGNPQPLSFPKPSIFTDVKSASGIIFSLRRQSVIFSLSSSSLLQPSGIAQESPPLYGALLVAISRSTCANRTKSGIKVKIPS